MEAYCCRSQGNWLEVKFHLSIFHEYFPGLVKEVVSHDKLLEAAQALGEKWAREGKKKEIPAGGTVQEYKAVNAKESQDLADAFLSYNFLNAQYEFLKSKGKSSQANVFMIIKTLRPLWSKLL